MNDTLVYGEADASVVLIRPTDAREARETEREYALIRARTAVDFCLTAVVVEDWNRDLSPWPAPAVFGSEAFGGRAAETLARVLAICEDPAKTYLVGGYSLAGLFALWAAGQTDRFAGVAAASPSVWFPGFTEYLRESGVRANRVCLSLGDKEAKTRNPVMATVADRIRETRDILTERGVACTLEWNAGGHFREPDLRTANAFARVMNGISAEPVSLFQSNEDN